MDFLWMFLGGILAAPAHAETYPVAEVQMPSANPSLSDPLFANDAGFVFKNALQPDAGVLNIGTVLQHKVVAETIVRENGTEYVDDCGKGKQAKGHPHTTDYGSTTEPPRSVEPYLTGLAETRGWFISRKTPPSPGLRVIVRNASIASIIEQMPYTDREYDKGSRSERFNAALGEGHESKYLALKSGENRLLYQIKRGDQVLESGEFAANIAVQLEEISKTTTISRPRVSLRCEREDERHDGKDRHRKER